jgi:DNA glycosylase AlkZ-like
LTEFLLPGRLRSVLRGSRRPRIVGGTMSASAPTDRADTLARRLGAQQLSGPPARGPLAVAERLLAIQAQDPRGARLAIRARTSGLTAADVDRELTERRSLLITWLNRGTLHLVRSEDYPLLHRLTTPPLQTALARRLAQEGVEPDAAARGVRVIEQAVTDEGPLGRTALRERLDRAGVPTAGQALVHLLGRAASEGRIVRGPMVGNEHAYVLVGDWLPDLIPTREAPREAALAELARRYLAGHGPATADDLARWAGLPLRDARAGLRALGGRVREAAGGLVELARARRRAAELPPPRLLGAFEPVLMGWRSRADVLGTFEPRVVTGGIFRGFGLIGGRAGAGWRIAGRRIEIEPFDALDADTAGALERDAEDVRRFLGLP